MILIDKYELLKEVAKRKYSAASMRLINEQPEVKAIPIEWIKNVWLKNPDNQGEIDFFPPATFEVVMNWLIEDWEKENERV